MPVRERDYDCPNPDFCDLPCCVRERRNQRIRDGIFSALICLGLLLIAHDPWVYVIALAFFFGEYFFIIRAEEDFLRQKFGAAYEEFLQKVPRWMNGTRA